MRRTQEVVAKIDQTTPRGAIRNQFGYLFQLVFHSDAILVKKDNLVGISTVNSRKLVLKAMDQNVSQKESLP